MVLPTAFSPGGRLLAGVSPGKVVLWEADSGKVAATLALPQKVGQVRLLPLAFSSDGKRLAGAWVQPAADLKDPPALTVRTWDLDTKGALPDLSLTLPATAAAAQTTAPALAFDSTGKQLAVALLGPGAADGKPAFQGEVLVWDTGTRRLLTRRPFPQLLLGLNFSADGRWLAACGGNLTEGVVQVWGTEKWEPRLQVRGHAGNANAAAFSPDGKRLLTGGGDGALKVWDTAGGQELLTLRGHRRSVTAVAFSPNGQSLLSATGLDFLDVSTIGTTPASFRVPMEVKVWEAPR
jgi:WD40 repeat protein